MSKRKPPFSNRCITLIGMPGSGKSTIGKRLAKQLNLPFVDTDTVLLEQTGRTTGELLAERGRAGFMAAEEAAVCSVRPRKPMVIATGGSVVYHPKSMRHLRRLGMVVYLDVSLGALTRRLGDLKARGVVLKKGQSLSDLMNERRRLYWRYADVVLSPRRLRPAETTTVLANVYRFLNETPKSGGGPT